MQWGIKIPLRDRVKLNATLYKPAGQRERCPVIFTLTPYISQTWHDRGLYFAAHGYPFLSVDARGRGDSEGTFQPFINEGPDGYDVVEWIAQQSYCNGQVAMWGGSYAGHDQWAVASEFPPHLATIVPVASAYVGVDFPIRNNMPRPYLMQWLTLVAGHTSQERIFADLNFWRNAFRRWHESGAAFGELDAFIGNPSATFREWIAHPQQEDYWDRYNPTPEQCRKISLPVLTITGIYDADQAGALMHYRQHLAHAPEATRSRHYLVIGPWDHAGTRTPQREFCGLTVGPASMIDLPRLHLQWYAWTMQRGARPEFLQKNVAYYVMGAEQWRYADTLEAITSHTELMYLQSAANPSDVFRSGTLSAKAAVDGAVDQYTYDPRDLSLVEVESSIDPEDKTEQGVINAAVGQQLVYHSAPFAEEIEISGFFELFVWLSINQPDTDFRASIYEISLRGNIVQLTTDSMRARYRQGLRKPELISSAEPLLYELKHFMFVSRRIAKGSRLRLVIGPMNSIYTQRNYNSGGVVAQESAKDARVVTVKLFHDSAHPSALSVPFGHLNH